MSCLLLYLFLACSTLLTEFVRQNDDCTVVVVAYSTFFTIFNGGNGSALFDKNYVHCRFRPGGTFVAWQTIVNRFYCSPSELADHGVVCVCCSFRGFPPVSELRQLVERAKERKKKLRTSSEELIVEGAEVCMRSCPLYEAGSRVALLHSGPPKIGQLVNPMYNINDNFEVKGIASAEEKRETVEKPTLGKCVCVWCV